MYFEINGNTWLIKQVEQIEFWKDDNAEDKMNNNEYYFGRCKFDKQEIWLCKSLSTEQKLKTLYHELLHCYRGSYISFNELSGDEDLWCDISSNAHDIIHKIASEYMTTVGWSNLKRQE